jgi:hypothetical protein
MGANNQLASIIQKNIDLKIKSAETEAKKASMELPDL